MNTKTMELANALAECIAACNHCMTSCLKEENVKMMAECIRLDKDCAAVCSLALNSLYEDSRFIREILMLCKNVCIGCKLECKKHPMDHCQDCYTACKHCAIMCEEFLNGRPQ